MKAEGGEGSGMALRSPADAPSASPSSFPSFCAQHGSSLFGGVGGWQAISDVMPAVQ